MLEVVETVLIFSKLTSYITSLQREELKIDMGIEVRMPSKSNTIFINYILINISLVFWKGNFSEVVTWNLVDEIFFKHWNAFEVGNIRLK